jgi:hypothetical protein
MLASCLSSRNSGFSSKWRNCITFSSLLKTLWHLALVTTPSIAHYVHFLPASPSITLWMQPHCKHTEKSEISFFLEWHHLLFTSDLNDYSHCLEHTCYTPRGQELRLSALSVNVISTKMSFSISQVKAVHPHPLAMDPSDVFLEIFFPGNYLGLWVIIHDLSCLLQCEFHGASNSVSLTYYCNPNTLNWCWYILSDQ